MKMDSPDYTKWHLPKGTKLRLGKGYINEIAYSPDSSRLAVASSIGIWIYDAETGEELALFRGHNTIERIAYSPDGRFIASSSANKMVLLWDAVTGEKKVVLNHIGDDIRFVYSPDGGVIATGSAKEVRLWDAVTGEKKATLTHADKVSNLVYSPDGNTIATNDDAGKRLNGEYFSRTVRLWDAASGEQIAILGGHNLVYSPDGNTIATNDDAGKRLNGEYFSKTVRLWDAASGEQIAILSGHNLAYSPDGNTIAIIDGFYEVRLWDAATGEQIATLTHANYVKGFVYSPDGNTIVTTNHSEAWLSLWDANTAKCKTILMENSSSLVYSPDGNTIATVCVTRDGNRYCIPGPDGETIAWVNSIVGEPVYSSDGNTIAIVCYIVEVESHKYYPGVCLWDARTGEHKTTLTHVGEDVISFVYSPDGKTIATGVKHFSDGIVRLWDATTGEQKTALTEHVRCCISFAYSPDGSTIATRTVGSFDSTYKTEVWLWDALTGKHRTTLTHAENITSFVYSPNNKTIATKSHEEMRLWETNTGKHKATLIGQSGDFSWPAYSPDGNTIVTVGYIGEPVYGPDGSAITTAVEEVEIPFGETEEWTYKGYIGVRLWDAETGKLKATLTHAGHVKSFMYSPDGRTIATSGEHFSEGIVRLWDAETGKLKATLTYTGHVSYFMYSPDGRTIATSGEHFSEGTLIALWDVVTGELKTTLTGHVIPVKSLTYSPDGKTIVIESDNGLRIWDIVTGEYKTALTEDARSVKSFAYSPDGKKIVIGDDSGLGLWNAETEEHKATLTEFDSDFSNLAYSPDGKTIAAQKVFSVDYSTIKISVPRDVQLWDAVTGEYKTTLTHAGDFVSFEYNPDGKTIATTGIDGTVLLWEIPSPIYGNPDINPQEIHGNWRAGWALDTHTLSSRPLPGGGYDTERTELGELVFQLKYRHDRTKIQPIAEVTAKFVKEKFAVDGHLVLPFLKAVLPIPPSDKNRDFQPVTEIAQEIGRLLSVPVRTDYLTKVKQTTPLKNLPDVASKHEQLRGAFVVRSQDLKNQCVLLVDDLYDSGATLTEATRVLYEQGGVQHVLVLALTRTRTGRN